MSDAPGPGTRFRPWRAVPLLASSSPASLTLLGRAVAAGGIGLALIGAATPWVVIVCELFAPGWLLR